MCDQLTSEKALHLFPTWSYLSNNIIKTKTNLIVHQYNTNIIIILTKYYTKHNNITHHIINIYETNILLLCYKFVHFVGFKFTPRHAINFVFVETDNFDFDGRLFHKRALV